MMRAFVSILLLTTAPALAQQQPPLTPGGSAPADPSVPTDEAAADGFGEDGEEIEEIVIIGNARPPGSVAGDITPEVVIDPQQIRGYGAASIGDLLTEIAPLTGSIQGRGGVGGRPVILLSGRRISSFAEIRDLPPEAIARIDILPEETALKYGYRADQKVVNIVLRGRFNAVTAEVEGGFATDGGREQGEVDLNYLRIAEGSRFSVDGELSTVQPLFETQRRILDADPDRTLLAGADTGQLNASYNRTVLGNVSATATGELTGENSRAGLGRSADGIQALRRERETRGQELGLAFTGDNAGLRWSLNGGYTRGVTNTLTDRDREGGIGQDRARAATSLLNADAVVNADLFALPAGDVATTVRVGGSLRDIESFTDQGGLVSEVDLSRNIANGQVNLDLPIASRRRAVLEGLGNLTLNANGGVEQLSDFGTLTTYGYGINWEPVSLVRLIASVTHEEGAPTLEQLGNPIIVTPNVRVLDVVRGETVDATVVEGGNPNLLADNRRVAKLGLTLRPAESLTLLGTYTDTRIDNSTASFPVVTPEIEAAFPDRFSRDTDGRLFRIDSRPVNLQRATQRQFRWGLNWSQVVAGAPRGPDGRLLTEEERRDAAQAARDARGAVPGGPAGNVTGPGGSPGGGPGFGRGGFGGGGFGGGRQGRVNVALFHTVRLEDSILIRDGVPELDLLDGSATGGRGGVPRHQVELRAGYNQSGLGVRVNADWQSGSRLLADPGGAASPNDLRFSPLTTVNLRLFADLGQQRWLSSNPFFRGARLTVAVDNILNQRLEARDAVGLVPLGYQPDRLDPIGRAVRVEFRKLFF